MAEYVRGLPLPGNMDALAKEVFGVADDKRADAFRQSVQYYLNGTATGFLMYCPPSGKFYYAMFHNVYYILFHIYIYR